MMLFIRVVARLYMIDTLVNLFNLCFPFLLIIGFVIFLIKIILRQRVRFINEQKQIAANLGLNYIAPLSKWSGYPSIEGQMNQFYARIGFRAINESSFDNRITYQTFQISFPHSLNMGLMIKPEGLISKLLSNVMTNNDVKVNDKLFDDTFNIQVADPNYLMQFLTIERKTLMYNSAIALLQLGVNFTINDIMIQGERRYMPESENQQMYFIINELVTIATALTNQ